MDNILKNIKEKVQEKVYKSKAEKGVKPTASVNTADLEPETVEPTPEATPREDIPQVEQEQSTQEAGEEVPLPQQPQIIKVPTPIFLSDTEKDKMIYNTHLMVKVIYEALQR